MKRIKVNKRKSQKMFTTTARKTHKKNLVGNPQRGGIRL